MVQPCKVINRGVCYELWSSFIRVTVRYAQTPLGIGLDPHLDRLPRFLRQSYEGLEGEEFCLAAAETIVAFNEMVLDAAVDRVAAVKPQFAL